MHCKFSKPISSEIHLIASYLYPQILSDFRKNVDMFRISTKWGTCSGNLIYFDLNIEVPFADLYMLRTCSLLKNLNLVFITSLISKYSSVYVYFVHRAFKRYFVFHIISQFQYFKTEIQLYTSILSSMLYGTTT